MLAEVYLELVGGRQPSLGLAASQASAAADERRERTTRPARAHDATAEERAAHEAFMDQLTNPIWKR